MRAARRDVHLGMDNTIKLHNSQRNINMSRERGASQGGTKDQAGQQDTLFWAACALLTFHYPVKYSKVKQAEAPDEDMKRDTITGPETGTGNASKGKDMSGPWPGHQARPSPAALPAYHLCQTRTFWLLVAAPWRAAFCHLFCLPVMPCGIAFVSLPFMTLYSNLISLCVCASVGGV